MLMFAQIHYNLFLFCRWTLAQYAVEVKQEKVQNTYYNNIFCYINNKNSDTDLGPTMSAIKVNFQEKTLDFPFRLSSVVLQLLLVLKMQPFNTLNSFRPDTLEKVERVLFQLWQRK